MKYYFYITTNNINHKYYYGVHSTNNIDDGYMGSGKLIKKAFKKYGKDNFTKTILQYFDNADLMYKYEANVVTIEVVNDPMSYNIRVGGRGGVKGLKLSEETKHKIAQSNKGKQSPLKGSHISEEHKNKISKNSASGRTEVKEKIRQAHIGKKRPKEIGEKISKQLTGRKLCKEWRNKISNTLKGKSTWNKGKTNIYNEDTLKKIGDSSRDRKWVNNGFICKMVKDYELNKYLNNGFYLGRIINKQIN